MADNILNKLFVSVKAGSYTNVSEIIAASSANPSKIYFVEDRNEIITKGKQYGASPETLSRITAAEEAIATLNGGAEVPGSVSKKIADAVAAVVDAAPAAFDTLKEIAAWISGEDGSVAMTAEQMIAAIEKLNADDQTEGSVDYKIKQAVDGINSAIADIDYSDAIVEGEYVSAVNQVDGQIAVSRTALPSVEDAAVAGQYVSAVSEDHGKITVSRAALPQLSVAANSTDFAGVADHEITIKTGAISGTVTSADAEGKVTPASYAGAAGLVTAAAVAQKLNEEATAFGAIIDGIDSRVDALENADYTVVNPKADGHVQVAVTDNKVVTVSENDIASAQELADYKTSNDAALEAAKDRITANEEQLAKLDGAVTVEGSIKKQINDAVLALDSEAEGSSAHVTVKVVEADGKLTGVTVSESDIASAASLATAEANITKNANAISAEVTARENAISGLKSELVAGASEGYQTMAALETKIKANAQAVVDEADARGTAISGLKAELLGDAGTDYNTLGKLEDQIQSVSAAAKSYQIVAVTEGLSNNVKEQWKLVDEDGVQAGQPITIYKDSSLKEVTFSEQKLHFTYILANGTESTVDVDVAEFLNEAEFGDGLQVVDHIASIKLDAANEGKFLSVSAAGLKLAGVQDAIDAAVAAEAAIAREAEEANADAINAEEERALAAEKVLTDNLAAEAKAREDEDKAINDKIGTVAEGKTVVEMIEDAKATAIASGTVVALAEGTDKITMTSATAADGHVTYTIGQSDIASAQGLADLKTVVGEKTDAAGATTVYGAINQAQGEVDALETYVGRFAEGAATNVVGYVDAKVAAAESAASNAIAALDATVSTNNTLINATVAQVDGKLTSITLDDTNVASKDDLTNAINALDATVSSAAEAKVVVTVVQTDGVLTSVTLQDKDIASAAALQALDEYVGDFTAIGTETTVVGYVDAKSAAAEAAAKQYVDTYDFWEEYGEATQAV